MEVALLVLWTVTGVIMLVLASAAFGGAGLGWGLLTLLVLHLLFFFPRVLFTFLLAPPLLALNVLCWPLRLFGLGLADPFFSLRTTEHGLSVNSYTKSFEQIIYNTMYEHPGRYKKIELFDISIIQYENSYDLSENNFISRRISTHHADDPINVWHDTDTSYAQEASNVWHDTPININRL